MKIVDANIILRYLLNDTEELVNKAGDILGNNEVYIPNEVIAEVVYVLEKVYGVKYDEISNILNDFVQDENETVAEVEVLAHFKQLHITQNPRQFLLGKPRDKKSASLLRNFALFVLIEPPYTES